MQKGKQKEKAYVEKEVTANEEEKGQVKVGNILRCM